VQEEKKEYNALPKIETKRQSSKLDFTKQNSLKISDFSNIFYSFEIWTRIPAWEGDGSSSALAPWECFRERESVFPCSFVCTNRKWLIIKRPRGPHPGTC
jgi:hypothetical protein